MVMYISYEKKISKMNKFYCCGCNQRIYWWQLKTIEGTHGWGAKMWHDRCIDSYERGRASVFDEQAEVKHKEYKLELAIRNGVEKKLSEGDSHNE